MIIYSKVTCVILRCNLNATNNHFAKYEHALAINEKNVLKVVIQVFVYLTLTFDAKIFFYETVMSSTHHVQSLC